MKTDEVRGLSRVAGIDSVLANPDVAHLVVHGNSVSGMHAVDGLDVQVAEKEGILIRITVEEGFVIKNPVHLCFGVLDRAGNQGINLVIDARARSSVSVLAHCVFPNAVDVTHAMDARIHVHAHARYEYRERHIHGLGGGVKVYPRARVTLEDDARFSTDFELIEGRVGLIDIDYEVTCSERSVMEMTAKISGRGDDAIRIREVGNLNGRNSRGVLTSRVAVTGKARADVYNKLVASAPHARGHVDCKEIVQAGAVASAVPVVEVRHPQARITHEAAIGSVDAKQLETLMSRGLAEEEAVELIIRGLLQ
jgi:Fe-S cluster assembly scaffold protein SufB